MIKTDRSFRNSPNEKIQENNNSIYKVYPWYIPCIYLHWVIYMVYPLAWYHLVYPAWIYHVKYLSGLQMTVLDHDSRYRLQLPKARPCEWATFPVALLRVRAAAGAASPQSCQSHRLARIQFQRCSESAYKPVSPYQLPVTAGPGRAALAKCEDWV